MHYIGVNYHKKYSYVVVKDKDGKVGRRGKVNNRREEFRQFLKPYQQGKAVLEATRNWGLIYDWLEEILDDVALENFMEKPTKPRYFHYRLYTNRLPRCYL